MARIGAGRYRHLACADGGCVLMWHATCFVQCQFFLLSVFCSEYEIAEWDRLLVLALLVLWGGWAVVSSLWLLFKLICLGVRQLSQLQCCFLTGWLWGGMHVPFWGARCVGMCRGGGAHLARIGWCGALHMADLLRERVESAWKRGKVLWLCSGSCSHMVPAVGGRVGTMGHGFWSPWRPATWDLSSPSLE